MIEEELRNIGLTRNEAKVYLSLIELGEARTGALCEKSKIPSSHIYGILEKLMEKGLVSYKISNNTKIFMASAPEALNTIYLKKQDELEKQRENIQKIIADLKKIPKRQETISNYKYFEGLSGIRSLWYEIYSIIPFMKKSEIARNYSGKQGTYENLLGFFQTFHKLRMKYGIKYNAIFPDTERKLGKKREKQFAEVRYMSLKNDIQWVIIGDMLILQNNTGKKPYSFLIKDEKFASTFKQVFDQLWKIAKK